MPASCSSPSQTRLVHVCAGRGISERDFTSSPGQSWSLLKQSDLSAPLRPESPCSALCSQMIVKTRTEYKLQQQQQRKLYIPGIKKLNVNLYDEVSEKVKLTGLILVTMAFLACLLMLVMYKALWYDQLSCPEGFVFKHKHCSPAVLEMYYTEQETGPQGSLYMAINHFSQGKKSLPDLPSPWMPVVGALKEAENVKDVAGGHQE
ncbi:neuron-specific vesicular protein calcyon isoform X1 [Dromaius novaehollandiae]|uniref:Calcyon neuron specific vesicular protein n=1 Tax=Dromaius novaehollandiae TaxID=8790 RepID=A0A8C4PAV1_DRONO|nr:neuron-specific vesicular protein calcyon isoform X1 [Dromaius novaehollandiae]